MVSESLLARLARPMNHASCVIHKKRFGTLWLVLAKLNISPTLYSALRALVATPSPQKSRRNKWTNVYLSEKGCFYCRNQVDLHVGLEDVSQGTFCHARLHELLFWVDRKEHYFGWE
jgi:hypothetical protein